MRGYVPNPFFIIILVVPAQIFLFGAGFIGSTILLLKGFEYWHYYGWWDIISPTLSFQQLSIFFTFLNWPYVYYLRSAKYNEIIYFVLSVKLWDEIGLPQTLLNALFSLQIFFIYFLRKSLQLNFQWQHPLVIFCLTHFSLRTIFFFHW